MAGLDDAGFLEPRPIQAQALPAALDGRDVLGLAQTGTGKTAAFLLPILQRLGTRRGKSPRALVVTPTRELANQVYADFERLAHYTPFNATTIFGGVPFHRQERALRRRPDVLVACPGRLLDHLNRGSVRLDRVETLVLDEADHMFDLGFLPDVRRILRALPEKRQNLLFSATMPREIRHLADGVLEDPFVVELGHSRPAETIDHALCPLGEGDKLDTLRTLIRQEDFRSAIVFLRTKRRAKQLAQRLEKLGHAAVALQGNMSQSQRERALQGFRDERFEILVATDIAARGLDIAGVSHVINYDVPGTPDAYTHRIGRTGRSELRGSAFTFVTPTDGAQVRAIEKRLGTRIDRRRVTRSGVEPARESDSRPNRRKSRPEEWGGGKAERRDNRGAGSDAGQGGQGGQGGWGRARGRHANRTGARHPEGSGGRDRERFADRDSNGSREPARAHDRDRFAGRDRERSGERPRGQDGERPHAQGGGPQRKGSRTFAGQKRNGNARSSGSQSGGFKSGGRKKARHAGPGAGSGPAKHRSTSPGGRRRRA